MNKYNWFLSDELAKSIELYYNYEELIKDKKIDQISKKYSNAAFFQQHGKEFGNKETQFRKARRVQKLMNKVTRMESYLEFMEKLNEINIIDLTEKDEKKVENQDFIEREIKPLKDLLMSQCNEYK